MIGKDIADLLISLPAELSWRCPGKTWSSQCSVGSPSVVNPRRLHLSLYSHIVDSVPSCEIPSKFGPIPISRAWQGHEGLTHLWGQAWLGGHCHCRVRLHPVVRHHLAPRPLSNVSLDSKKMFSACFFNLLSSSAAPLSPLHWQASTCKQARSRAAALR